ncbi:hypothetical protein MEA186_02083 [Mesorhizobium amorphae CCNWGS0123]|uniref:Uncharacterized protein n=1 Tax=Mesorhizobium amorphae CCNWGS0123 TaxID=1082933 RepID=G6Y3C1_9HYPH|nr:hypothetical protein MEA186_02083 [Mesorhizobium amorphae CCNWGS0123]
MEILHQASEIAFVVVPILILTFAAILFRKRKWKEAFGLLIGGTLAAFNAVTRFGWLG